MKLNFINSIFVLVLSIVACSASSSKTIPTSSKTIPTSNSSKTISTTIITNSSAVSSKTKALNQNTDGYFTTSISVSYGSTMLTLPNNVADVTMTCYPPKGLRKRDVTVTKTISSSKVIPNTSSTSITKVALTVPTKRTPYPWEIAATYMANEPLTKGLYTFYSSSSRGGTVCKIYTRPFPIATTVYFEEYISKYQPFITEVGYRVDIDGETTTKYKIETTSYGYRDFYTRASISLTATARNQLTNYTNYYKMRCTSSEVSTKKIPYIETVTYETPIDFVTSTEIYGKTITTTFLNMKSTYVTSYSSGTYTYTECSLRPLSTKQLPVTTTTISTKQPPVITTTTNEQSPVITTTTSTKQPPVITTTTTELSPVITTTTSTKQPPVITTTTTTTTSEQVNSTKCIPAVITVTEKEKVTVTEKETITVTVTENGSTQTNGDVRCAKKWAQCGGVGFNGPTCCESGSTCKELNQYYSQCI